MCRVTMGHPRVTIGHLRVIMGHLRLTIGCLKTNTTELHPKVRQTCLIYYASVLSLFKYFSSPKTTVLVTLRQSAATERRT